MTGNIGNTYKRTYLTDEHVRRPIRLWTKKYNSRFVVYLHNWQQKRMFHVSVFLSKHVSIK